MKKIQLLTLLISCVLTWNCATIPGGSIALNDDYYFQEYPKILTHQDRYFLRWRYANKNMGLHYMRAFTLITDDKLVFYIPVTTSTGDRRGKLHLEEIASEQEKEFIKNSKAFWLNPDNTLILLEVDKMAENEFRQYNDAGRIKNNRPQRKFYY